MMKRGLFGCDLKNQVFVIGILYCALSIMGVVFGFLLFENPGRFADRHLEKDVKKDIVEEEGVVRDDWEQEESKEDIEDILLNSTTTDVFDPATNVMTTSSDEDDEISMEFENDESEELNDNLFDDDLSESQLEYGDEDFNSTIVKREIDNEIIDNTDENFMDTLEEDIEVEEKLEEIEPSKEMKHYMQILTYLENEGIEAIIGSFLKLFCSLLLIQGVRSAKPWFLIPWLVEECVEMIGGFFHIAVQLARNQTWGVGSIVLVIFCYLLGSYLVYSVASYHALLRRMNKNSDQIISSVCQGGFQVGRNYQRLEEECWQAEPNITSEMREERPANKFARPGADGFTREKKVDLTNDNDEHVLYFQ